jgi:hypothetical protein
LGCDARNLVTREFLVAAAAAATIGALCLLLRRWQPRDTAQRAPGAGTVIGVAAVVALIVTDHATLRLVVGLVVLGAGAAVGAGQGASGRGKTLRRCAALIPGAAWLAFATGLVNPEWVRGYLCVVIAAGGALVVDADRSDRSHHLAPLLLGVSAVAMYESSPDPSLPLAVLGAAFVTCVLTLTPILGQGIGPVGGPVAVGLVCWVAAVGGTGRPSDAVGAMSCLGLLAIDPLAHLAGLSRSALAAGRRSPGATIVVLAAQAVVAGLSTRLAGGRPSAGQALEVVVAVSALAVAAVWTWSRRRPLFADS